MNFENLFERKANIIFALLGILGITSIHSASYIARFPSGIVWMLDFNVVFALTMRLWTSIVYGFVTMSALILVMSVSSIYFSHIWHTILRMIDRTPDDIDDMEFWFFQPIEKSSNYIWYFYLCGLLITLFYHTGMRFVVSPFFYVILAYLAVAIARYPNVKHYPHFLQHTIDVPYETRVAVAVLSLASILLGQSHFEATKEKKIRLLGQNGDLGCVAVMARAHEGVIVAVEENIFQFIQVESFREGDCDGD